MFSLYFDLFTLFATKTNIGLFLIGKMFLFKSLFDPILTGIIIAISAVFIMFTKFIYLLIEKFLIKFLRYKFSTSCLSFFFVNWK